jgi:hypothetical protein
LLIMAPVLTPNAGALLQDLFRKHALGVGLGVGALAVLAKAQNASADTSVNTGRNALCAGGSGLASLLLSGAFDHHKSRL